MLTEAFAILSCSNITCTDAPLWYLLAQNWAAHGFLGVLLAAYLPKRWAWFAVGILAAKEIAGDFPRDPALPVLLDSAIDLFAVLLGARLHAPVKSLSREE